jgi:hypothetical protein
MRKIGKMVMAIKMIPVPPNHCRIDRHNKIPRGTLAKWGRIVAPVVVRAETDSKVASTKLSDSLDQYKGRPAKREAAAQLSPVSKNASRTFSSIRSSGRLDKASSDPTTPVINMETIKACQPVPSRDWNTKASKVRGTTMVIDRMHSRMPMR